MVEEREKPVFLMKLPRLHEAEGRFSQLRAESASGAAALVFHPLPVSSRVG